MRVYYTKALNQIANGLNQLLDVQKSFQAREELK